MLLHGMLYQVVRVLVDCCGQEKAYNPYYALVGSRFCEAEVCVNLLRIESHLVLSTSIIVLSSDVDNMGCAMLMLLLICPCVYQVGLPHFVAFQFSI